MDCSYLSIYWIAELVTPPAGWKWRWELTDQSCEWVLVPVDQRCDNVDQTHYDEWEKEKGEKGLFGSRQQPPLVPEQTLRLHEEVGERQQRKQAHVGQQENEIPYTWKESENIKLAINYLSNWLWVKIIFWDDHRLLHNLFRESHVLGNN